MIRKQIYIKREQEEMLKRRSRELGVTEADIIRQGLDEVLSRGSSDGERLKAWQKELAFMKERAKKRVPQTGRDWTRDELYEERLGML